MNKNEAENFIINNEGDILKGIVGKRIKPVGASLDDGAEYLHFANGNFLNNKNNPDHVNNYACDDWEEA